MGEQRCGTCRWFQGMASISGYDRNEGLCEWPMHNWPQAAVKELYRTLATFGSTCPTYLGKP